MHRKYLFFIFCCGVLPLEIHGKDINWSGYGSIAAGKLIGNNDTSELYPFYVDADTTNFYNDKFQFSPETTLGLQANAAVNESMSFTAQLIGKGASKEFGKNYDVELEWLYASIDITPETKINAGRFRMPLYYYTDFIDASYAYHWVRAPMPTYSSNLNSITGVKLFDIRYIGDFGITNQIWYGAEEYSLDATTQFDLQRSLGITSMIEYSYFTLRGVYSDMEGDITFVDPVNGNTDIVARLIYSGIAFMVDYEALLWYTEIYKSEQDVSGSESSTTSGYTTLGYRFGDFLPHYTHSKTTTSDDSTTVKVNTAGIRWDFKRDAALKIEYSNYKEYSQVYLINDLPGEHRSESFTIALDFVF